MTQETRADETTGTVLGNAQDGKQKNYKGKGKCTKFHLILQAKGSELTLQEGAFSLLFGIVMQV